MNQPAQDHNWDTVRERLRRAAEAIAASEGNFEQREAAAMRARTGDLARSRQESSEQADLLEIVTFRLGGELYAVETKYVFQIMARPRINAVPRTPEPLLGVINLRGEILAVFDLNPLFGIGSHTGEETSRLIVLGEGQPQFGFIADAVDQVTTVHAAELISPMAPFGLIKPEAVRGVTAEALIILDGETLLGDERLVIEQRDEEAGA
jgi:purine-binding chemotaxis protein CheW